MKIDAVLHGKDLRGRPIDQMRDYLTALQAIWRSWRTGEFLDHRGPYCEHFEAPTKEIA